MKSSIKNRIFQIIAALITLIVILILYASIKYIVTLILSLDKELIAAIIAASGTVFASVAAIILNQNRTKRREIEEAQRPNKIAAYQKFMKTMVVILKKGKDHEDLIKDGVLTKDLEDMFLSFQSDMIVWASPSVIKTYEMFKNNTQDTSILLYLDDILREIRSDLGHKNKGLKRGDLIKLFLRDSKELDKLINS